AIGGTLARGERGRGELPAVPDDDGAEWKKKDDVAEKPQAQAGPLRQARHEYVDTYMLVVAQGIDDAKNRNDGEDVPLQIGKGVDGDAGAKHGDRFVPAPDRVPAHLGGEDRQQHRQDQRQHEPPDQLARQNHRVEHGIRKTFQPSPPAVLPMKPVTRISAVATAPVCNGSGGWPDPPVAYRGRAWSSAQRDVRSI